MLEAWHSSQPEPHSTDPSSVTATEMTELANGCSCLLALLLRSLMTPSTDRFPAKAPAAPKISPPEGPAPSAGVPIRDEGGVGGGERR